MVCVVLNMPTYSRTGTPRGPACTRVQYPFKLSDNICCLQLVQQTFLWSPRAGETARLPAQTLATCRARIVPSVIADSYGRTAIESNVTALLHRLPATGFIVSSAGVIALLASVRAALAQKDQNLSRRRQLQRNLTTRTSTLRGGGRIPFTSSTWTRSRQ